MQKETRRNSAAGSAKPNPPRKLTRAEKKQIAEIIRQAKGDGKAHTAQQTIPYIQMYPDGICHVSDKRYSKSIAFEDINYQLAQADDKTAIFETGVVDLIEIVLLTGLLACALQMGLTNHFNFHFLVSLQFFRTGGPF